MNDQVFTIIKELAKGAKRGEDMGHKKDPRRDPKISEQYNGKDYSFYNCRYLLNQFLRHYDIPLEHRKWSKEAYNLALKLVSQEQFYEKLRYYEYTEQIVCDRISEGEKIAVEIYKGNEKEPKIEELTNKTKKKFNAIFTADHVVPISMIVSALVDNADMLTDDFIAKQLDRIYICTILKSEDRKLPAYKRDSDYESVIANTYNKAGIFVVE